MPASRHLSPELILLDSSFKRAAASAFAAPADGGVNTHTFLPSTYVLVDSAPSWREESCYRAATTVGVDSAGPSASRSDGDFVEIISLDDVVDWSLVLRHGTVRLASVTSAEEDSGGDGPGFVPHQDAAVLAKMEPGSPEEPDASAVGLAGSASPGMSGSGSGVWGEPLWANALDRSPPPSPGLGFAREYSPSPAAASSGWPYQDSNPWASALRRLSHDAPSPL